MFLSSILGEGMDCLGGQGMVYQGKTETGQGEKWKDQAWEAILIPGGYTEART